jgi:flagellar protein FlaJ
MKLKKYHYIAIAIALAAIIFDFLWFWQKKAFFFILGLAILFMLFPFLADFIFALGKEKEKEEMFVEFMSDLAESVKTGIPISRSILNISKRDYKALDKHVKKLANQIALGIPLITALETFAKDTRNKVIARSIELISQAERAGGKIEDVISAAVANVREIEDIKKKRSAAIHSMTMQGYIIFFVFLLIMVFLQMKFIPEMMKTLGGFGQTGLEFGLAVSATPLNLDFVNKVVLVLIVVQGFFSGIVISKLAEGKLLSGLKHSFILIALSFLILEGARALMK